MLVAVIAIFLVMSFTGVAVLDVSHNSSAVSQETVTNIKLQYLAESAVNKTLWRINSGADSLVNFTDGGVSTVYDSTTNVLTITFDTLNTDAEIEVNLSEDTHFERAIASLNGLPTDIDSVDLEEDAKARDFDFMPEIDSDYFTDNAVQIHSNWWTTWSGDTLEDGIHVFTGDFITLEDITLLSGTIVIQGKYVSFRGDNYISAPEPDSTGALPALVFEHEDYTFDMYSGEGAGESIYGAIFAKHKVKIRNGTLTGPVIAGEVDLGSSHSYNFIKTGFEKFYTWTHGFGNRDNYDWPKQIEQWKTKRWERSQQHG